MLSLLLGLKILRDTEEWFTADGGRPQSPQPSVQPGAPSHPSVSALLHYSLQRLAYLGDGRSHSRLSKFPLFYPFLHPLSSFCLPFYFSNHSFHLLYSSPTLLFHLLLSHVTFNRKKKNSSHFFASLRWFPSSIHTWTLILTHIPVHLFNRSLLRAVSVVGTALGSGHIVVHLT